MRFLWLTLLCILTASCSAPEEEAPCFSGSTDQYCQDIFLGLAQDIRLIREDIQELTTCQENDDCEGVAVYLDCGGYGFSLCSTIVSSARKKEFTDSIQNLRGKYCTCEVRCHSMSSCDAGQGMCGTQNSCY